MPQPSFFPIKKTAGSLLKGHLLPFMIASAVMGCAVVIFFAVVMTWLWARLTHFSLPYADAATNVLMGGLFSVAGWFMLPALVVFIVGLFQDAIVHRVEKKYYPEAMGSFQNKIWHDLLHDIRFTIKALALNLLVLPFYLIAVGPVLSLALNSYLLGREFFETAASYHMAKAEAWRFGNKNKMAIYMGGFLITVLTIVPVLNVFAPVFALAYMVHLVHTFLISGAKP